MTTRMRFCLLALAVAVATVPAIAQQVPIPTTAAEVPGPTSGPMTQASIQTVGRMAYIWGWPLVYVYNQRTELTKAPETALLAGVMPIGPMNQVVMLTSYIESCRDLRGNPEPGCRVRVGLAVSRKGTGGHASARLW